MGAATDTALQLARDIEAEVAAWTHADDDDRRRAAWEIVGAQRLAARLDYDAAEMAFDEFAAIQRRVLASPPGGRGGLAQIIAPAVTL